MSGGLSFFTVCFPSLFSIVDPIGVVPVYLVLVGSEPREDQQRTAARAVVTALAVLLLFAATGTAIFHFFGITIPALQIAGGLVVAHSGFGMLVPRENLSDAEKSHSAAKSDISFSPMALPLIAGPGAIGVVIALAARYTGVTNHVSIAVAALRLGVVVAVALRFGTPIVERLGPTGVGALTRVMGFLILTIGVELVIHGVLAVDP